MLDPELLFSLLPVYFFLFLFDFFPLIHFFKQKRYRLCIFDIIWVHGHLLPLSLYVQVFKAINTAKHHEKTFIFDDVLAVHDQISQFIPWDFWKFNFVIFILSSDRLVLFSQYLNDLSSRVLCKNCIINSTSSKYIVSEEFTQTIYEFRISISFENL